MPCLCRFCPGVYSFLCSRHCSGPDIESKGDCSLTFILGYLVYFAVFELVIVPMTLKWVSLTAAAYIWAGIMALVICAAVICTIKNNGKYVPDKRKHAVEVLEAFLKYGKITL